MRVCSCSDIILTGRRISTKRVLALLENQELIMCHVRKIDELVMVFHTPHHVLLLTTDRIIFEFCLCHLLLSHTLGVHNCQMLILDCSVMPGIPPEIATDETTFLTRSTEDRVRQLQPLTLLSIIQRRT